MLDDLDMDTIELVENSIEESWSRWKEAFVSIMNRCIPKVSLSERKNLPWLTKVIINKIKKRNYFYKKSKSHGRPEDFERYKSLRNNVVSMLHQSKARFFESLDPNLVRVNHSGRL